MAETTQRTERLPKWSVTLRHTDGHTEVLSFLSDSIEQVRAAVANWLIDRPWWQVENIERVR